MTGAGHAQTTRVPARTVAAPARVDGVGLFTAAKTSAVFRPAEPGTGLRFDVDGSAIPAVIDRLSDRPVHPAFEGMSARNTTLAADPTDPKSPRAVTTEHALAALVGLGITDCVVELHTDDGPRRRDVEVPIDDGSARAFVGAILAVGVRDLGTDAEAVRVDTTLAVQKDDASVSAGAGGAYAYELDYGPRSPLGRQSATLIPAAGVFAETIAPARTFSLEHEATAMHAAGLFRHISPRDLLVIGERGPIDNAYRFNNEPAAHKLLDLMGDLALVGRPMIADVRGVRSGHALNHELARRIVASVS
ncbi:MAG: UDP-3-O-acyl-N-acetylglucosamine deacetylase [Planctomycetota bacterium]